MAPPPAGLTSWDPRQPVKWSTATGGQSVPVPQEAAAPEAAQGVSSLCVAMPRLARGLPGFDRLEPGLVNALHFLAGLNVSEIPVPVDAGSLLPRWPGPGDAQGRRLTVVLDLDETLVHCRLEELESPRPNFTVSFEDTEAPGYVYVRPFAPLFLEIASRLFEVVVFTASSQSYADQVLDLLDPDKRRISKRLYRQHCTEADGGYLKDLRRLGRPLDSTILVDNSPVSLALCPDNGVAVSSYVAEGGEQDRELMDLLLLLQQCAQHESASAFLAKRYGLRAFLEDLRSFPDLVFSL